MAELDKQNAIRLLNGILEAELAGVVRYTHYSLLVFGIRFSCSAIIEFRSCRGCESRLPNH
jgi:bacterioferritin